MGYKGLPRYKTSCPFAKVSPVRKKSANPPKFAIFSNRKLRKLEKEETAINN